MSGGEGILAFLRPVDLLEIAEAQHGAFAPLDLGANRIIRPPKNYRPEWKFTQCRKGPEPPGTFRKPSLLFDPLIFSRTVPVFSFSMRKLSFETRGFGGL